ncbi:MAG: hypothetical protein QXR42_01425 [Candidatus Bathyarchaeia archaeon]
MKSSILAIFVALLIINLLAENEYSRTISLALLIVLLALSIMQTYYILKVRKAMKTWREWAGFDASS